MNIQNANNVLYISYVRRTLRSNILEVHNSVQGSVCRGIVVTRTVSIPNEGGWRGGRSLAVPSGPIGTPTTPTPLSCAIGLVCLLVNDFGEFVSSSFLRFETGSFLRESSGARDARRVYEPQRVTPASGQGFAATPTKGHPPIDNTDDTTNSQKRTLLIYILRTIERYATIATTIICAHRQPAPNSGFCIKHPQVLYFRNEPVLASKSEPYLYVHKRVHYCSDLEVVHTRPRGRW